MSASLSNEISSSNLIALRKTKIVYNFGLSECNRVRILVKTYLVQHSFRAFFWGGTLRVKFDNKILHLLA